MNLQVFGKTIVKCYDHYLYRLNYKDMTPYDNGRLEHYELLPDNLDSIHASNDLKTMLVTQSEYLYGLGFRDAAGNVVGHAFLMFRGGTEVLYKIRDIDSYVFAVRVFEEYRGNNYSRDIVTRIIDEDRKRRGIEEFYLTVKKDNIPARKTYERLGFEIIGERSFHRIPKLNLNIPYHEL